MRQLLSSPKKKKTGFIFGFRATPTASGLIPGRAQIPGWLHANQEPSYLLVQSLRCTGQDFELLPNIYPAEKQCDVVLSKMRDQDEKAREYE